jgi:hypothetical protein
MGDKKGKKERAKGQKQKEGKQAKVDLAKRARQQTHTV